jgi:hypothetical protein
VPAAAPEAVPAAAPEADMFDKDKDKCLALYMSAHEKNANHYTKKAAKLRQKAHGHNDDNTKAVYMARADELERVRDKKDFTDWFEEDKRLFKQFDLDGNGFMDKKEFVKFAEKNFHMTESEAKDVFKKWDIDEGKEIGPFEFVTLMAVWHGEYSIQVQRCMDHFVIGGLANAMPCGCCPDEDGIPCCAKFGIYFGVCCSLPTLCLSWIPCYLITTATAANIATDDGKLMEKAAEEATEKSLDKTKEVLLKGPAGRFKNVIKEDQTVQNPVHKN